MAYKNILYEKDGHVVTITINRPEVHNCVNRETAAEIAEAWRRFRDDADALVAIMTGAGPKSFCSGWDLKEAAQVSRSIDFDQQRVNLHNSDGPMGYTRRLDIFKPTIAAINGYCFAGGLEIACSLDIRIAADHAEFGCLERRWNVVLADGGTQRLPLIVGLGRAMELIITGRRINAEEALRIGLITEMVPRERLVERARELAKSIAALPQGAIRSDKEALFRGLGRPLEEGLRLEAEMALSLRLRTDLAAEGARAFLEKRKPAWEHHGL